MDLPGMQEYTRTRHAKQCCRVSLRRQGSELSIIVTNEIAAAAGITIGSHVRLYFNANKVAIVPTTDGPIRVRKLRSGRNTFPHLLMPIGVGKPVDCCFDKEGPHACQHEVDDDGLLLVLPQEVHVTTNH